MAEHSTGASFPPDPPAKRARLSSSHPAWSDLPPELIGTVSTFLSLSDARSLVVTAGRDVAGHIRRSYLKRNFRFLALALPQVYARRLRSFRAWMEVNDDWRDLYDQPLDGYDDHLVFEATFNNLLRSVQLGLVEVSRHLVEVRGADINTQITIDETDDPDAIRRFRPILIALLTQDRTMLEYLLQVDGIDINYQLDEHRQSRVLHLAAADGRIKACDLEFVLTNGRVDVDATDALQRTPLHCACFFPHSESVTKVQFLLDAGANANAHTLHHEAPWDLLLKRRRIERTAFAEDQVDEVKCLLHNAGAPVEDIL